MDRFDSARRPGDVRALVGQAPGQLAHAGHVLGSSMTCISPFSRQFIGVASRPSMNGPPSAASRRGAEGAYREDLSRESTSVTSAKRVTTVKAGRDEDGPPLAELGEQGPPVGAQPSRTRPNAEHRIARQRLVVSLQMATRGCLIDSTHP